MQWAPLLDSLIDPITNLSAVVDPASYITIAAHAFQVAARYGATCNLVTGYLVTSCIVTGYLVLVSGYLVSCYLVKPTTL